MATAAVRSEAASVASATIVCTSSQPPPPPPKKGSRKGDTSGKGLGKWSGKGVVARLSTNFTPVGSPSCDSPGTVPISVYLKVCQERDVAVQERDTARVAARAVPLVEQELATIKGKPQKLQDELLDSEHQRAAAEARYDVLQR